MKSLNLKSTVLMDGARPINLFNTALGLLGKASKTTEVKPDLNSTFDSSKIGSLDTTSTYHYSNYTEVGGN